MVAFTLPKGGKVCKGAVLTSELIAGARAAGLVRKGDADTPARIAEQKLKSIRHAGTQNAGHCGPARVWRQDQSIRAAGDPVRRIEIVVIAGRERRAHARIEQREDRECPDRVGRACGNRRGERNRQRERGCVLDRIGTVCPA